MNKRSPVLFKR